MKIKILIVFILIIAFIFFIVGWNWNKNKAVKITPSPAALKVPLPSFSSPQEVVRPPLYDTTNIAGNSITIPIYINQPPSDLQNKINNIARVFGLNTTPTIENTSKGTYYVWNEDKLFLRIGGDPLEISFDNSNSNTQQHIQQSGDYFTALSKKLITDIQILNPNISLSVPKIAFLNAPSAGIEFKPVSQTEATAVSLKYQQLLDNYGVIMTDPPKTYTISAIYDSTGTLITFFGRFFPGITKMTETVNSIALDEAKNNLQNEGQILLTEATENNPNYVSLPQYVFNQAEVMSWTLVYFYSPGQNSLSPLLVFSSNSIDSNSQQKIIIYTAVSAIK